MLSLLTFLLGLAGGFAGGPKTRGAVLADVSAGFMGCPGHWRLLAVGILA